MSAPGEKDIPGHLRDTGQRLTAAGVAWQYKTFRTHGAISVKVAHNLAEARVKGVAACDRATTCLVPISVSHVDHVEVYVLPDVIGGYADHWATRGYWGKPEDISALTKVPMERLRRERSQKNDLRNRARAGCAKGVEWATCPTPDGRVYYEQGRRGERGSRDKEAIEAGYIAAISRGEHLSIIRNEWRSNDFCAGVRWYGHAQDLVEAGVCAEADLRRAKPVVLGREKDAETPNRRPAIKEWKARRICEDFYEYWVEFTSDESRRLTKVKKARPNIYSDPDAFAAACERAIETFAAFPIAFMTGEFEKVEFGETSIAYPASDINKVRAAIQHVVQVVQSCTPYTVARPSKLPIADIAAARRDDEFAKFMSQLPMSKLPHGPRA